MATVEIEVNCPYCNSSNIVKNGKDKKNKQRFLCKNKECNHKTFLLDYSDIGRQKHIKDLILKMAINGSGIRDTARVLEISPNTVIETIKKANDIIENVNYKLLRKNAKKNIEIDIVPINAIDIELDEMWSFVEKKSNQRWLWLAIDHNTGDTVAFVFGKRKDEVFLELKKLLEPFNIKKYYTDNWGSYSKNLDKDKHEIGKKKYSNDRKKKSIIKDKS
jgi:IS1 family transposase/transposase-like protein